MGSPLIGSYMASRYWDPRTAQVEPQSPAALEELERLERVKRVQEEAREFWKKNEAEAYRFKP